MTHEKKKRENLLWREIIKKIDPKIIKKKKLPFYASKNKKMKTSWIYYAARLDTSHDIHFSPGSIKNSCWLEEMEFSSSIDEFD